MQQDSNTVPLSAAGKSPSTGQTVADPVEAKLRATGARAANPPRTRYVALCLWGWSLLGVCRAAVAIYMVVFLLSGFTGIYAAQYLGEVTSHLQMLAHPNSAIAATANGASGNAADQAAIPAQSQPSAQNNSQRSELFAAYFIWIALALSGLGLIVPLRWLATKMDSMMANRLREDLFDRVLGQSPEFFHRYTAGDLNTIVNNMTVECQMTLRQIIVDPVLQLIMLAGTTGQMIYNFHKLSSTIDIFGLNVPSTAIPLAIVGVSLFFPYVIGRMGKVLRGVGLQVQRTILALSSLVTSAVWSPEEIQVLQAEKLFSSKHKATLAKSLEARLQQQAAVGAINILNQLPSLLVQIVLLGLGLWLALTGGGRAPVGNVVAILGLAPLLMSPINQVSACLVMLFQNQPSLDKVSSILQEKTGSDERPGSIDTARIEPKLEAHDLVFSYGPGSAPVFRGLNFSLPPRMRTGFVAKMGEGKTTFFKLMLRFYDPQAGEILLGGLPTTDYTVAAIRRHVVMMTQFPAFFYDTLRENMRMARPDATDAEIEAICRQTGMWDILTRKTPAITLETDLAAARALSGGQKKLLALTRCLLRDPTFLLLDEPTVGMDNEEKFQMIEMLRLATEGKTVMVVDHDVNWLLQFCDNFVVMDEGIIVEQGTAQDLLSRQGLLYQLYVAAQGPKTAEIASYIHHSRADVL